MPSWLRNLGQFVKDAGRYGIASEIAASILFIVTLVEHARDKTFSSLPFICLSALLLFLGGFLAWSRQCHANKALQDKFIQLENQLTDVPNLNVAPHGFYADIRPLAEQVGPVFRTIAQLSCLNVKFKNDPRLATQSSIARNILAELEFFDESGHLLSTLLGRWGDSPQPPHLPQGQSPAQTLAMVDFGIGQERELNIAFKYQDEADCFGMSNETYAYKDWKHPKQKLVRENIKVRVRLRGVGVDSTWDFWFHNPKGACLQKVKHQQVIRK